MLQVMNHRGPDERRIVELEYCTIGTTRLSILERTIFGSQPMRHNYENSWLAFNGEIYNHRELRTQLPAYNYSGHSDTETLLHALATWGVETFPRLNGIFAIAFIDIKRRKLLLARDRFGVKPLYISRYNGSILFASEIKAILQSDIPRNLRPDALPFNIVNYWTNGRDTLLQHIENILPGTWLNIDLDTMQITENSWYTPAFSVSQQISHQLSEYTRPQAIEKLEALLRSSVQDRLLSDAPVGCLCSGGLDSSLVTALAAQEGIPFTAYNASFPDQPEMDENDWARQVCSHINVPLTTIPLTKATWKEAFVESVYHFEFPLVHESNIPLSLIAKRAAKDGVRVLLSGEGADELFGGYRSRHLRERHAFLQWIGKMSDEELAEYVLDKRPIVNPLYNLLKFKPNENASRYELQLRSELNEAYSFLPDEARKLEAALASDLLLFMSHSLIRLDKNVMQYSVEGREPFLAPSIVELGLNLPIQLRSEPEFKGVLLDLGYNHLPSSVLNRPKQGFSFDSQIYFEDARIDFLRNGRVREILKLDGQAWVQVEESMRVGRTALRLWSAEVWLRLFENNQSISSIENEMWLD